MKRIFLFLLVVCQTVSGQNLVPNPSFEEHKTCDFIVSAIDTNFYNPPVVNNWCSGNYSGTPDYFNNCQYFNPFWNCMVPVNLFGNQKPITGNAYAGIGLLGNYNDSIEVREYIQTKLLHPLKKDVTYCVGFYTSFPELDSSVAMEISIFSLKNWGLLLSNKRPFNATNATSNSPSTAFTILASPQIKANDFIKDTANWVLVNGIYTATGDEEWITIGNFNPPFQTPIDTVYKNSVVAYFSYYYIDDVFVIPMNEGSLLPSDTSICTASFPIELSAFDGFTNYNWSNGDTTKSTILDQQGIYAIHANYEGCQITDTIEVTTQPVPVLNLPTLTYCVTELPITYSIPENPSFTTFEWSDGSTTSEIVIKDSGDFILKASGECGESSDTLRILIDTIPLVNLGDDRSLCENGNNILIELSNTKGVLPNYLWSNGQTNAAIQVSAGGTYTLSSQNECGIFTDEVELLPCPFKIYAPNIFSPSAQDYANTSFKPFIFNAELISVDIYDRWGEHLYTQKGENNGWDGTWKGKTCSEGVYVYLIRFKTPNNQNIQTLSGDVTLIR